MLYGVQSVLFVFACGVDFGFDHPGRFGFDFGDFIRLTAVYGIVTIVAFVIALGSENKTCLALVIVSVPVHFALFAIFDMMLR